MGLREALAEEARRQATGDNTYTADLPFVLQIVSPNGLTGGGAIFQLPLPPESYHVSNRYRQGLTPTAGGLVVEERGILWRDLTIGGTFGLAPKPGQDTTQRPMPPNAENLSGPMWTLRLLRNVLGVYAELKADAAYSADTYLVWHDVANDDHWVVVPETVDTTRTAGRRFQHPYEMRLKAIADASERVAPAAGTTRRGLGREDPITRVRMGLALAKSAVREVSAVLGEVRAWSDQVDGAISDVGSVIRAAADVANGVTRVLAVGTATLQAVLSDLEAVAVLLEASDLPAAVRREFMRMQDGVVMIAAQAAALRATYTSRAEELQAAAAGLRGEDRAVLDAEAASGPSQSVQGLASRRRRSTDADLLDAGAVTEGRTAGSYPGVVVHTVQRGETLPGLAARYLGSAERWFDLAQLNGLRAPYVSDAGVPGTVAPGGQIRVPAIQVPEAQPVLGPEEDLEAAVLGRGPKLVELPTGVGWVIDPRTSADVQLASGRDALVGELSLRLRTDLGSADLVNDYGVQDLVGLGADHYSAAAAVVSVRQTVLADPRVVSVLAVRPTLDGDELTVDVDLAVVSRTEALTATLYV